MKIAESTTVRHRIGTCPACRSGVWGEVDLDTLVSPPTLADDGKAHAIVHVAATAMRLEHDCGSDAEEAR